MLEELHVPVSATSSRTSVHLSSPRLNPKSSLFYLGNSRFAHISSSPLKYFLSIGILRYVSSSEVSDCSGCKLEKFSTLPFQ